MKFLEILRAKLAELEETRNGLLDELESITSAAADESRSALNDEEEARFAEVRSQIDKLDDDSDDATESIPAIRSRIAELEKVEEGRTAAGKAPVHVNAGKTRENPYDLSDLEGRGGRQVISEIRSRALTAVENHRDLDDDQKEAVTRMVEGRGDKQRRIKDPGGFIPAYVLRTGSDHYGEAFHKYMAGRSDLWTDDERRAVQAAEEIRAALSTTDANGGYAIPFTLDPTLILTNDGTINPVRQLARQESITTNQWNGLTSAGASFGFDAEMTEVSDDSPTFAQPSVNVHKAQGFIQGSIEITQDYPGLVSDLQMIFADGKDRLESVKFINGAGDASNEPTGIITALDGGSSEVSPATAETFAVADVYATAEALPPRWRGAGARNAWLAELSTINAMRQFGTANNYHGFLTDLSGATPRQLIGYSLFEASEMDAYSAIDTGATADHHLLVFGDWRQYLIVDRVGMTVEYIPHLFNTTSNRPDGRRGWYAHWRVGADSLVDGAFRTLNVATTL